MEGGLVRQSAEGRVHAGRADSVARFFSRQTIIGAFVAVIALIFHVTGSTGPGAATTNMSVFVLSILIAQVTMPHRHLRHLLSAPSHTTRYVANPESLARAGVSGVNFRLPMTVPLLDRAGARDRRRAIVPR